MMTSHSLLGRHCQLSLVFDNFDIDVHGRLNTVRRQEISANLIIDGGL